MAIGQGYRGGAAPLERFGRMLGMPAGWWSPGWNDRYTALAAPSSGTATSAPTTPAADTPMRAAVMVAGGDRSTALPTTSGPMTLFSNCWYSRKNTTHATPTAAPWVKPSTTNGMALTAPPI